MKQHLFSLAVFCLMIACNNSHTHPEEKKDELEALSYTIYTAKSELFVEFKPLVVGEASNFAVHLTKIGESFLPYMEGTVTVSLMQAGKELKNTVDAPSSPGIFRLALQPTQSGIGRVVFDVQTKEFTDQFVIDGIKIYNDEKAAIADQPDDAGGGDISYLKEQAWKVDFANAPVQKQIMYDVVKATGEILSAPGDQVTVAATSNGIVKFIGNQIVAGSSIQAGRAVFAITGGQIPFENVAAAKQSANAELTASQSEFDRASDLIKDKLITQREFQDAKLRLENAKIAVANLNRNYSASGKTVSSPITGIIKSIHVTEGQIVSTGEPLIVVVKNQKLVLKADVSLKDATKISSIADANFTIIQNNLTYNTKNLNGKLLSVAKTIGGNTPYIPVTFQIDGQPDILAGSFAQVYIRTVPVYGVLAIPTSSLIEEQGIMYAYVQTEGESFQKRELKLGMNDGQKVQVLSGLSEGERVVTKGAYQIKLSQASGTMPAHGHEH
jgi:membrane fusion protein, heavy metal efflux system